MLHEYIVAFKNGHVFEFGVEMHDGVDGDPKMNPEQVLESGLGLLFADHVPIYGKMRFFSGSQHATGSGMPLFLRLKDMTEVTYVAVIDKD